jgi:hypothetical protein
MIYTYGEGVVTRLESDEPALTEEQLKSAEFLIKHAELFWGLGYRRSPLEGHKINDKMHPVLIGDDVDVNEIFVDFWNKHVNADDLIEDSAARYVIGLSACVESEGEVL